MNKRQAIIEEVYIDESGIFTKSVQSKDPKL